jgi:hypothetical protein
VYSDLNQKAQEKLTDAFSKHVHNPSPDQLKAVLAIQDVLTRMLSGHAAPKYYLSALDPGMGKTTAILTWLEACLENPTAYGNQGVLIALDRLDEIQRYIEDGQIPRQYYAVLVSDGSEEGKELNNMGLGKHGRNNALILFTTKKQIHNRSHSGHFNDVSAFHYNGQPRRVKIWDESFTIGKEAVLNLYDFGRLLTPLNAVSSELSDAVLHVVNDIIKRKNGDVYQMPELPVLPKELGLNTIWETPKEREIANLLWRFSGQLVSIRADAKSVIVVDCVPSIPDDFAPCLILDASARLKATYELQDEQRNDIIRLPYSNKSYRNLEVNVWPMKSGKQIIKDSKIVLPELVQLFDNNPNEHFLVILHKDHKEAISTGLSKQLTPEQLSWVKFCTWARHTATNEFSDIANIIMLSPFQFPDYAYEATTRAATVMTTAKGKPIIEHVMRVKKGEISSNILQAVNRGKPRKSEGDTCPPCRLWLITHPNTGIAKELPNIFPECRVVPWKVKAVHLTSSKQRKTFAHLKDLIKQGVTEVMVKTVREHLGFKGSPSNFTRDVINQSIFVDALNSIGWKCVMDGINYVFRGCPVIQAS